MGSDYLLTGLTGILAQLVDGTLGMGFGITCTTLLVTLVGLNAAGASAVVHAAELGTTLASGLSHWKFGNINWPVALKLGIPGAIGAGCGATLLAHLSTAAAGPWAAFLLVLMGINVIYRFSQPQPKTSGKKLSTKSLSLLGLLGGFVDVTGGGGWGPITSATLMSLRQGSPRQVVGTVNTAEFLVTAAATIGFVLGLGNTIPWLLVVALMVGGMIAAPLAAFLVSRVKAGMLGSLVGAALIISNAARICSGPLLAGVIVATVLLVGAATWRRRRALQRLHPVQDEQLAPAQPAVIPAG